MDDEGARAQSLALRLFTASLGAAELLTAYLGLRLGLYDTLAATGPLTVSLLAQRAGIAPRYAREWLEQQAAAGILEVDDIMKRPEDRLFLLPPGHVEALTDLESPYCITPLALLSIGGVMRVLPRLVDAFRTGAGVPYAEYAGDLGAGQRALNRAVFTHHLPRWVETAASDVDACLRAGSARVADIGCGAGWSSIVLARVYPGLRVEGFDSDAASIEEARRNAVEAGVADRVTFEICDGVAVGPTNAFDLVCVFDALHDMARPVEVLRTCRALLVEGGSVLVLEPNVAEVFNAPASETERFFYAVSLLHCLPVGLSEQPSAATGTMIRPDTIRAYAAAAGFAETRLLAIKHPFHRLYRLLR